MDEFEEQLRRYRPAGPPPDLRDRIAAAARAADGAEDSGVAQDFNPAHAGIARIPRPAKDFQRWFPAVAAALVAVVFSLLAGGVRRDVAEQLGEGALPRAALVSELTASLGGGPAARDDAERLVELDELKSRAEPRGVDAGEGEVNTRD